MPVRIRSHNSPGMLARSRQRLRASRKNLCGLITHVGSIGSTRTRLLDPTLPRDLASARLPHGHVASGTRTWYPFPAGFRIRLLPVEIPHRFTGGLCARAVASRASFHRHREEKSWKGSCRKRRATRPETTSVPTEIARSTWNYWSLHRTCHRPGNLPKRYDASTAGGSSAKGQRLRPRRACSRRLVVQGLHQVGLFLAYARRRAGCPRRRSAGRLRPARPDRALLRRGHLHR